MKIGIMGGTFDPIHYGHLIAAEQARTEASLDEVWFMPARIPPHKPRTQGATPEQRLAMVKHAIRDHNNFRECDIELTMEGPSYSINTLKLLTSQYPEHSFHYIIGADMVEYLPNWYQIEEIVKLTSFVALQRPGYSLSMNHLPTSIQNRVKVADMPGIDISSTNIRDRIREGRSIRYLVSDTVRQYIKENGLYES